MMPPGPTSLRDLPEVHRRHIARVALELRVQHGLTYPTISTVLHLYEAVDVGEAALRTWLNTMGVPRSPAKARVARRTIAKPRRQVGARR